MSWILRLKLTIFLVILSVLLSLLSLFTNSKVWGNIYHFFSWILYSQHLGSNSTFTEYRIYSKNREDIHFKRNKIAHIKYFNPEEYYYTFNQLVKESLECPSDSILKIKLFTFVKYAVPNAQEYKIMSETYNPDELLINPLNYDTVTVIRF